MNNKEKETMTIIGTSIHEMWSHWMKHLFSQGWDMPDGKFSIKRDKVEKWRRQMEIPFSELSEEEQKSDIKVFLDFMKEPLLHFSKIITEETLEKIYNEMEKKND